MNKTPLLKTLKVVGVIDTWMSFKNTVKHNETHICL